MNKLIPLFFIAAICLNAGFARADETALCIRPLSFPESTRPPIGSSAPGSAQTKPWPYKLYYQRRYNAWPAVSWIVEANIDEYARNAGWMLELGSGEGWLASLLPNEMLAKLVQSDINQKALEDNPYRTRKKLVDVYGMPFRNGEVPVIVSMSALDTVDIDRAAKEMFRVLAENGVMIGFFDLMPNPNAFMARFPDCVLFPAEGPVPRTKEKDLFAAFLKVNRRELENALAGLPLDRGLVFPFPGHLSSRGEYLRFWITLTKEIYRLSNFRTRVLPEPVMAGDSHIGGPVMVLTISDAGIESFYCK